jgi:hypothetical protein
MLSFLPLIVVKKMIVHNLSKKYDDTPTELGKGKDYTSYCHRYGQTD